MRRILGKALLAMLAAMGALYAGDWAVWRTRVAMGGGMGTVQLGVLLATPLKNGREEYDWAGIQAVDCSRSLFPHAGEGACWWLARQKTIEEK